jgi:hypothetical protein
MLPLSHTYVSTKATGRSTPLLILGNILPDICTTSSQQISRDSIHNNPEEFNHFIKDRYPKLSDIGLGVRLHSQVNKGEDYYSDDLKVGYAKIEGAKISSECANLIDVPVGEISLALAHNFIEMAVDLHLYKEYIEVWNLYKEALENIKAELPVVAECMSIYLKLEKLLLMKELDNLIALLDPYNLTTKEVAVENLALPIIKLRFGKEVSREKALVIAEKALTITKPTYKAYLDYVVIEVRKNILGNRL